MTVRSLLTAALSLLLLAAPATAHARAWPTKRLELGVINGEGEAAALAARGPFAFRYQYLSGGVNTPGAWQSWARGNGTFVTDYVTDSRAHDQIPVFSYYELRQSAPGNATADEASAVLSNLRDPVTMRAYYEDFKVALQRAADGRPVVMHVEPDLWGYMQQRHGDRAADTPAAVAATGMSDLAGLPDTAAGFAQALRRLRDNYAPRVLLAYSLSIWGTGKDIAISDEPDHAVDQLAARSAMFYRSLGTRFDVVFGELADRDAGYAQNRDGAGISRWWDELDFRRHVRYLRAFHQHVRLPLVMWQIPLGNTISRSVNNTPYHYQDNRVQWLLDPAGHYRHLRAYRDAGVVAMLFGSGQAEGTSAEDAARDGVTNPPPIGPNHQRARVSDDDGGVFAAPARAYYRHGRLRLAR